MNVKIVDLYSNLNPSIDSMYKGRLKKIRAQVVVTNIDSQLAKADQASACQ
jgi:hypothetical protein